MIAYDPTAKRFLLNLPAHVVTRAKRIWPELATQYGLLKLSATLANAVDLKWFLGRYPVPLTEGAEMILRALLAASSARDEAAEAALSLDANLQPANLALPLRDYQVQAVRLVQAMGGLLLGDVMGLGKTVVGIGLCAEAEGFCVVVCQTHLQRQWKDQFAKFAPSITVEIAKTTAPHPVNSKVLILPYSKAAGWSNALAGKVNVVVLDECQEIRHNNSGKYKAIKHFSADAGFRLGLSGTPIYNYGGEVFNILDCLQPGCLGAPSEFFDAWCTFRSTHWIVTEPNALGSYLKEQKLMLRRTKIEVSRELPEITRLSHVVEYDASIMKQAAKEADELAQTILTGAFTERGLAARQLSLKLRQSTGLAKAPFVAEFIMNLCHAGEKVVLAGWHREFYVMVMRQFRKFNVPHWLYTGSESPAQKDRAVKEFCSTPEGGVFILSLRSGAGLDGLQSVCSTVVFGELDWSPQVHEQLIARVHRDGQDQTCTAIYLVAEAGSDPVIASILGIKREQGHGITDPTVPLEALPVAEDFDALAGADGENRARSLATAWLARKK